MQFNCFAGSMDLMFDILNEIIALFSHCEWGWGGNRVWKFSQAAPENREINNCQIISYSTSWILMFFSFWNTRNEILNQIICHPPPSTSKSSYTASISQDPNYYLSVSQNRENEKLALTDTWMDFN